MTGGQAGAVPVIGGRVPYLCQDDLYRSSVKEWQVSWFVLGDHNFEWHRHYNKTP